MPIISLSHLVIDENRQRRAFDEKLIAALAADIAQRGLMHAPVVRADGVTLIAGERRTRAIMYLHEMLTDFEYAGKKVPHGMLPVIPLSALSDLEAKEAELAENTIRLDLSWQEKASAIAELHALRSAQKAPASETQTFKDTASEIKGSEAIGGDITSVRDSLILAEHLSDPEVAAAKSQKDAVKILRKKKEAAHRAVLAEQFDQTATAHTLHHGDALEYLQTLESETFDCLLTDPPYGIGADTFGDMSGTGHNYSDSVEYAQRCYSVLAEQSYRVTKSEAHAYVFCDFSLYSFIADAFALAGWTVWPRPLIWAKGNGMLPRPEHGPRYTYEMILFASKGSRRTLRVAPDVISIPLVQNPIHGAQKPVDLYLELLSRTCLPGQTVLDPFGGSGTILPAATSARLLATMCELDEGNFNMAVARLTEEPTAPSLDLI